LFDFLVILATKHLSCGLQSSLIRVYIEPNN